MFVLSKSFLLCVSCVSLKDFTDYFARLKLEHKPMSRKPFIRTCVQYILKKATVAKGKLNLYFCEST